MTDAPDRMFVFPKNGDWFNAGASTHKIVSAGAKDVEYTRADLHAEAIEAAERRGYARGIGDALNKVSGCARVSEVGPALRALAELKGENQ